MDEFLKLKISIPKNERSPKYYILSAMYSLEAHKKPVTSQQISEFLMTRLEEKELPRNIPSSLKAYESYVAQSEIGPPKKWILTETGINHLRKLSSLPLKGNYESHYNYDIGIICALQDPEMQAVIKAFSADWIELENTNLMHVYRTAEIFTTRGTKLRLVATTSTSMGLTAAAIATTHLINNFKPRIVAMIGIAAGTRSGSKEFGDVLVADPTIDYNSGKVVMVNGVRQFQPDPYPLGISAKLRSLLSKYKGKSEVFKSIRSRWEGTLPIGMNSLHVGPLGAADQVIDDPSRIEEIQQNWRKLVGIEMETYGVYRAASESAKPQPKFVSFKSVCDFAAEKTDNWQPYAAFSAAEFAYEFFKNEWEYLEPIFQQE